jgi:PAS domain S-box-containing protein
MVNIDNRVLVQQVPFSALVVEDEPDYALIVQKCLEMGVEPTPQIRHAETLKQALRELSAAPADIILLDLNLPDSLGFDTVRALNTAAPSAAIIVITATGGEDIAKLMLRGGAQDFMTKDEIDARTLNRAIMYALERKRADNELRSSRSQVRQLQLSHDAILRATPAALASLRNDWSVVWANDSMKQLFDAVGRPGTSLRDLFTSDESFANYTASARARTAETLPDRRELVLALPDGKSCVCELNLVRLDPEETAAGYLATLVDVTDRAVAEEQRESLIRLAQGLSSVATEEQLGQVVAQECRRVFHHDAFWFSRYSATENSLRHYWVEDTAPGDKAPAVLTTNSQYDVLPHIPAFANGTARLLNRGNESQTAEQDHQLRPIGHVQRRSMSLMFAPIVWQGDVLGVISVQSYIQFRYNEPDLELLSGFADQCSTALVRIQAQGELQASEVLYRGIVQDQTEAIIRLTPDLVLTFCNRSFSRIVGADATRLPGNNYLECLAPQDRKRLKVLLKLIRPDNQTIDVEHALVREGTEACRLIWTYRGIFDEQGQIAQYQAVGSDVTRLRIAESALARSEQRLELIVSQIPAFLYTTDEKLRFTSVLGRFAGFSSGLIDSEGEIVGKHVTDVLVARPDEQARIDEAHELSLHTGATTGYLFNSHGYYFQARVQPLRRSDSEIIGVVGIALDVTERVRNEEQQRRLQEELHSAEKLAVIGRAMASIGHCMKNMLTGLNGGMFLVDRCCDAADSVNPMLLQAQDLLRRSSSRISLLLLNMLDVSKERQANFLPTYIPELLDEVVAILRTSALAEGIEIYAHVDPDAKHFCLDSDRLYRALLNLGLNSLDAMSAKGRLALIAGMIQPGEVSRLFREIHEKQNADEPMACRAITQLTHLPDSPMLRIDVADTGSGMDREVLDQLFEPFFSTKHSRGTGLGLSATLHFVQNHNGHILVQSELNRGTTFTLLLPNQANMAETSQDCMPSPETQAAAED